MTAPDATPDAVDTVPDLIATVPDVDRDLPSFPVDKKTGTCACGKDGTPEAHGWFEGRIGFTCAEVRVMRNLYEAAEQHRYVHRATKGVRSRIRARVQPWIDRLLGEDDTTADTTAVPAAETTGEAS